MKKRFAVDRIEGALAVLISDSDNEILTLPYEEYGLSVNDILDITLEGGKVLGIVRLENEKDARLKKNSARLSALFAKGKKK
ncbi:MAG: hypothetical protein IJY65_04005 [Clostridia bacterium]|nr:hypothetical protein [Clostridia bacterium]